MKEERLLEIITHIDSDHSMDQRITQELLTYDTASDLSGRAKLYGSRFAITQKGPFLSIAKAAAAILLFAALGTTTVFAAGYLIKSYEIKNVNVIPEASISDLLNNDTSNRKVTHFGDGHENVTRTYYDSEGKVISSDGPADPNKDDMKYGNEAFGALGLPNLTPTYLYDNYLVEKGGYRFIEDTSDKGEKCNSVTVGFYAVNSSKYVFIQYIPSGTSSEDMNLLYSEADIQTLKRSTYTAKSGILCNLTIDEKNDIISADIIFDSKTLGNAHFMISCTHIQIDEVKDILDSIPFTEASELQ